MPRWKLLAVEPALRTPWMAVQKKSYVIDDGSEVHEYFVVERRPFVLVVAIGGGGLTMLRHYRQGTDRSYLELPAGYIEEGESAAAAAVRELREETGLAAGRATVIGELHPLPGYVRSSATVVVCEELSPCGPGDGAEEIEEVLTV